MKRIIAAMLAAGALLSCSQGIDPARVVTNPIDLDYEFTLATWVDGNFREAADPVCILYQDRYYLFVSKSDGYWSSDDMQHWRHIRTSVLPMDLYAPTAMEYKGELYWMTSDLNSLWKTTDPEDGQSWTLVTDHLTPYPENPERTGHDPDLFLDSDGRVYLYWGCSNVDDIMGIELDPENGFRAKGGNVTLITHRESEFGWERPGDYNEPERPGYNEGPTIFKKDGKYYKCKTAIEAAGEWDATKWDEQTASWGATAQSYKSGIFIDPTMWGFATLSPMEHFNIVDEGGGPGGWHETTLRLTCLNPMGQFRVRHTA